LVFLNAVDVVVGAEYVQHGGGYEGGRERGLDVSSNGLHDLQHLSGVVASILWELRGSICYPQQKKEEQKKRTAFRLS